MNKYKRRKKYEKTSRYILILIGLLIMIVPMYYMVVSSFKDNLQAFSYPPKLFPAFHTLKLDNYIYVINSTNFFRYLFNTIIVSGITVILSTIISSMLAYSFARLNIPGKKIFFALIIGVMLVPGLALIIPQFELASKFRLINSLWGVILFYTAWVIPFSTFLLKGYIEDNISYELDESIFVDGGSIFTVYFRIILPMSSPSVAAISIFNFLFPFEELGWSQQILKSEKIRTLPVAISMFFKAHAQTDWGYVFAMTTLSMIPMVILYLFLQKYFVSGLAAGSIKG